MNLNESLPIMLLYLIMSEISVILCFTYYYIHYVICRFGCKKTCGTLQKTRQI